MNFLRIKTEDHIVHIMLDRGRSNAMDIELVQELINAIDQAQNDPAVEGIILSGKQGFFSSGLDLITLFEYNEIQIKNFWISFMRLVHKLTACNKPLIAAISGHSPAGGCVLALCCDYRIMAKGDYIIGLNEVPIGLIVPQSIFKLYSFWLGEARAYRSLMEGKLFNPEEAVNIGLVDEIVDENRIQNATMRKIKSVTQFDKTAWMSSKQNIKQELITALQQDQEEVIDQILSQWWKPKTRSILKTIIDNLTKKKG